MPALPDVPNVIRARISWAIDGDALAQTVHYFRFSGSAGSASDMSAFAAALVSQGDTHFGSVCATTVGMTSAEVTDLTTASSIQAEGGTPWVGTLSGGINPPSAAFVIQHTISRRYRGGKPRSYLPLGSPASIASTGLWGDASVSVVDSAWGAWVAAVTATYGALSVDAIVNVSFYHGSTVVISPTTGRARNVPTVRATPEVDTITGHTTSKVIGSQRRRNRDA